MINCSKLIVFISLLCFSIGNAQDKKEDKSITLNKEKILKELSESTCQCIDSIPLDNPKDSITKRINRCIDDKAVAYQLAVKLSEIKDLEKNATEVDGKKQINIDFVLNKNSEDYKKAYYELESYLMENCKAIKLRIASNNKESEKSFSKNPEALKYYNLGIAESNKDNFAKALEFFKKAVVFDSQFAFAYDNIGVCYRNLNEYDKAIDAYEKSLEIDPNGLLPLQNLPVAYIYKKNYNKAVKCYERLAKVDKNNPEVFYGIGQVYIFYLNDLEKGLDNACLAYNIYVEQKSPYRSDAEKMIQYAYDELKKQGKEKVFEEILTKNHIRFK